eukprot:TRINITY_DN11232_c0_g1_i1.p1 TRINITY_DN11232_c0_g1~~TRINITY_DN11232_c0_g1_i1.p1  ORF type:complete len:649 (+),score=235.62 TRINITY_DN11232_c0_g1_i1:66-1949(+)
MPPARGLRSPLLLRHSQPPPSPRSARVAGGHRAVQSNERLARAAASLQRCSRMLRRRVGYQAEDKQFDRQMRMKDGHIAMCSAAGLVTMIAVDLTVWYLCGDMAAEVPYSECSGPAKSLLLCLQLVLTISTFVVLALLMQYYHLQLAKKRKEWSPVEPRGATARESELEKRRREKEEDSMSNSYSLWASSALRGQLLCEMSAHAVHPVVFLRESMPALYAIAKVWMFFRLYVLGRVLHTHSAPFRNRFEIVASSKQFERQGVRLKPVHTLKILFTSYTATAVIVWTAATVMLGGFGLFLAERDSQLTDAWVADPPNWAAQFDRTLWVSYVTASTIGYGDYWPSTLEGRLVTVLISMSGICLATVLQALVTNNLKLTKIDKRVQEHLSLRKGHRLFTEAAVTLIQRVWREKRARRVLWKCPVFHLSNRVYAGVRELKEQRLRLKESRVSSVDIVLDEWVDRLTEQLLGLADRIQEHQDAMVDCNADVLLLTKKVRRLLRERQRRPAQRSSSFRGVPQLTVSTAERSGSDADKDGRPAFSFCALSSDVDGLSRAGSFPLPRRSGRLPQRAGSLPAERSGSDADGLLRDADGDGLRRVGRAGSRERRGNATDSAPLATAALDRRGSDTGD